MAKITDPKLKKLMREHSDRIDRELSKQFESFHSESWSRWQREEQEAEEEYNKLIQRQSDILDNIVSQEDKELWQEKQNIEQKAEYVLHEHCKWKRGYISDVDHLKDIVQDLRQDLKNIETSQERSNVLRKTLNELCKKSIDLFCNASIIEEHTKVEIKIQDLCKEIRQIEERLRFLEPLIPIINRVLDKVNKE